MNILNLCFTPQVMFESEGDEESAHCGISVTDENWDGMRVYISTTVDMRLHPNLEREMYLRQVVNVDGNANNRDIGSLTVSLNL